MTTAEKIEQLTKERSELWEKYHNLGTEIRKLELEDCNYEGKYICVDDYGYMFVTWQHYDEKSIYNDERMFFQGFAFKSCVTDYRDDFWFQSDACEEWNIPIDTFQRYVRDNKIKEITKEEFINEFEFSYNHFHKEYKSMLEHCEKQFNQQNK